VPALWGNCVAIRDGTLKKKKKVRRLYESVAEGWGKMKKMTEGRVSRS
jgi:hypothetical protein